MKKILKKYFIQYVRFVNQRKYNKISSGDVLWSIMLLPVVPLFLIMEYGAKIIEFPFQSVANWLNK